MPLHTTPPPTKPTASVVSEVYTPSQDTKSSQISNSGIIDSSKVNCSSNHNIGKMGYRILSPVSQETPSVQSQSIPPMQTSTPNYSSSTTETNDVAAHRTRRSSDRPDVMPRSSEAMARGAFGSQVQSLPHAFRANESGPDTAISGLSLSSPSSSIAASRDIQANISNAKTAGPDQPVPSNPISLPSKAKLASN